jgi:hypothetical protein
MVNEGEHRRSPNRCDQKAGKLAKKLVAGSPVPATMHGYGTGRVSFEFSRHQSITFDLRGKVAVLNHLHWLKDMDAEAVLEFVRKIREVADR